MADGLQHLTGQGIDGKPHFEVVAVADQTKEVAVKNVLPLLATADERGNQAIDRVGQTFGLGAACVGAEPHPHRARPIDQKEKTGGIGLTDFGAVRHSLLASVCGFAQYYPGNEVDQS